MTNLIALDPATHAMVLTSLKIVMRQLVLNVNLMLIIIPHLNALEDAPPTDPLTTTLQPGIHMKLITMQSLTHNFHFPPTNCIKWLNCWKPPNRWQNTSKGHSNTYQSTIITVTAIKIKQTHPTPAHKHKPHYHKDEVNEITLDTWTPKHTPTNFDETPDNTYGDNLDNTADSSSDSKWLSREHEIIEVKLSNSKYAANFPAIVNNNQTVSLFNTGATISCILKSYFDKLYPRPLLITKHPCRVNSTDSNSLGSFGIATCTLEFPKKFQQWFIICEHLLRPIVLSLDFSHNYQIGIDWFSTHQLHVCP